MRVIRARVLGYCMGVRRAVEMASRELGPEPGFSPGAAPRAPCRERPRAKRVYTLGPLIHNPQVLAKLKNRGVETLDAARLPGDLRGAVVILRAHGVTPALEAGLVSRGALVADATCPKVKASQNLARSLGEAGYRLFLAGEEQHGEIVGIRGYAGDCLIVGNPGEAALAAENLYREAGPVKTALLGQTTISPGEYRAIGEAIASFFPNLAIQDTICGATRDRQDALTELSGRTDALIVVGGRASANTRRLLSIAESLGKPAWLAENAGEIPREIAAYPVVGLSAGASTPDEVIDEIEGALLSLPSNLSP
ncbi:MAG: 4-hydroxy-3-methylbut-2-enyl diphosphate reductase [Spirochaetaceae bacterium]|jgi:4-hydroxy-3-methylbut-2-enyl diphosphate reductase|nr:4-hydroxy-3-methylbut-2-enyl diphosphate reductase [Spirochaetaceae bacterium]